MRGVPVTKPPAIIARRAGLQIEAKPTEFGAAYSVQNQAGAILYQGNSKAAAMAWLEGYAEGMRASGQDC